MRCSYVGPLCRRLVFDADVNTSFLLKASIILGSGARTWKISPAHMSLFVSRESYDLLLHISCYNSYDFMCFVIFVCG